MASTRNIAGALGGIAAVTLFLLVNPWIVLDPNSFVSQAVTVVFWISFIALLVVLFQMRKEPGGETIEIEGPAFTRFLFGNSRAGLFWLPIRLFVGFTWLEAGWHKFSGTGWIDGGAALQGYWQHAVADPAPAGSPAITYDWYRTFLQTLLDNNAHSWFAPLITFGEMAVGHRPPHRTADRLRGLLRSPHEHVVPARGLGIDQPGPVHPRHRADARLEGRRLLRRGPVPASRCSAPRGIPHRSLPVMERNQRRLQRVDALEHRGAPAPERSPAPGPSHDDPGVFVVATGPSSPVAAEDPRRLIRRGPLLVGHERQAVVARVVSVAIEPPAEIVESLQLASRDGVEPRP